MWTSTVILLCKSYGRPDNLFLHLLYLSYDFCVVYLQTDNEKKINKQINKEYRITAKY